MMRINTRFIFLLLFIASINLSALDKVAYNVNIETSNNNTISVQVPQLKSGQYKINSIYIKTKEKQELVGNIFNSNALNKSLENISLQSVNSLTSSYSTKMSGTPVERMYIVDYEIGIDSYDLARELMNNPDIEYAVPVFNRNFTDFTPNDPELGEQWYIGNQQAAKVWDITKGSEEVIIGIVDSGTDWQHPDLIGNIYINPDEIANNGIDDDNNGYIDDVNGWDFVGNVTVQQAVSGQYFPDNNPKPATTANEHGTHVAGCASAVTNNSTGIASLGFNTKLLVVKCGSDNVEKNTNGTEGIFRGYQGMIYAAENGADIINCSWGGPGFNPAEQEIINSIAEMGVLILASSGNKGENIDEELFSPAGYKNVLTVGSYTSSNRVSGFSNYGISTDIFSPGSRIYSTLPNGRYGNKQGTSMSSPIAAGIAALVKSLHPDWTPHQIMAQLRSTTDPFADVPSENRPLFFGRINAFEAVTANANNFSTKKVKGMAFSETDFAANSILESYEYKNINLKLVNYLAPVDGVRIEFIPIDKFIDIETAEVIVNGLATMDTSDVELSIKLNELNPWYDGPARVLIKYTAEDYTDYQLLKIPVEINSPNNLNLLSRIAEENSARFYDVHSPEPGVVWAVGQSTAFNNGIIYNNAAGRLFLGHNDPLTGVYAYNSSTAFAVTGTGKLLNTTNSGTQWNEQNFSNVTSFFNGLYVFNEESAVAFGDPLAGEFGIINTTNAGNNWQKVSSVSAQSGENGLVGSHCMFGDRVWFGTTAGRVVRGRNYGKNWLVSTLEAGATVQDIAFQSNLAGIAIYTNPQVYGDAVIMAKSNDGGINWSTNVINFRDDLGVTPVELIYNESADKIYVVCEDGRILTTKNQGSTWSTELNMQGGTYERAAISNDVEKFVLYGASATSVTALSFVTVPEGAVATLTSQDGNDFRYDSTEVNKVKNNLFTFKNDGELTVKIDSIYFTGTDKDNFSTFGTPPSEVAKGNDAKILVTFRPKEAREYDAQVVIVSNNENGDIKINLSGKGFEPAVSSVEYMELDGSLTMYPQPAKGSLILENDYQHKINAINMLDLSGKMLQAFDDVSNYMTFDLSNYDSGVYLLQFVTVKGTFYKKFIKE